MRLKLVFERMEGKVIPFNTKYAIASWIYRALQKSDDTFSRDLHTQLGFKGFTFSNLFIPPPYKVLKQTGLYPSKSFCSLIVSCYHSEFMAHLVNGAMNDVDPLILGPTKLQLSQVKVLKSVYLTDTEYFRPLSPIVCSTRSNGGLRYLEPHEEAFYRNLKINLRKKYTKLTGKPAPNGIEIKPAYELMRGNIRDSERIDKGRIIAFRVPVKIRCHSNLMNLAYDAGLGERNSMGFGMLKLANSKNQDMSNRISHHIME